MHYIQEHPPQPNAFAAFAQVDSQIKKEWIKLRRHWDEHEPKMFAQAVHLSDNDLAGWKVERDLVSVSLARRRAPKVSPEIRQR